MPRDDNMSIILGRPFLNTTGAVIHCNKGKGTFNVDDKEHTVYFPKRIDKVCGVNTISNVRTIKTSRIPVRCYGFNSYVQSRSFISPKHNGLMCEGSTTVQNML
jgi:hypothetical protein